MASLKSLQSSKERSEGQELIGNEWRQTKQSKQAIWKKYTEIIWGYTNEDWTAKHICKEKVNGMRERGRPKISFGP